MHRCKNKLFAGKLQNVWLLQPATLSDTTSTCCHPLRALRAEAALAHALAHKPRMHSRTKKSCTSACCATLCGRCVLKLRWRMHSRTNRACTHAQTAQALTHKPRMHSRSNRTCTHAQTCHTHASMPHVSKCMHVPSSNNAMRRACRTLLVRLSCSCC